MSREEEPRTPERPCSSSYREASSRYAYLQALFPYNLVLRVIIPHHFSYRWTQRKTKASSGDALVKHKLQQLCSSFSRERAAVKAKTRSLELCPTSPPAHSLTTAPGPSNSPPLARAWRDKAGSPGRFVFALAPLWVCHAARPDADALSLIRARASLALRKRLSVSASQRLSGPMPSRKARTAGHFCQAPPLDQRHALPVGLDWTGPAFHAWRRTHPLKDHCTAGNRDLGHRVISRREPTLYVNVPLGHHRFGETDVRLSIRRQVIKQPN